MTRLTVLTSGGRVVAPLAFLAWFGRKERRFRHWREAHPNWLSDPAITALRRRDPAWWVKL
jgi:hypothetical protein